MQQIKAPFRQIELPVIVTIGLGPVIMYATTRQILLALAGLVIVCPIAYRQLTASVAWSDAEVIVRNVFRTVRMPWGSVEAVGSGKRFIHYLRGGLSDSFLVVALRVNDRRRRILVLALPCASRGLAASGDQVQQFVGAAQEHGVGRLD